MLTQYGSYNDYGELASLEDNTFGYILTRNKNGQIITKTETLEGADITYAYRYDELGRLIEVKKDNRIVESYAYDANGNRASATVYGVSATGSYTLDDSLQTYGDNTYRYDDDGYLVEKTAPNGTTTYTYNTLGALTKVTLPNGTIIEYPQDALNRRVAKKINDQVVETYLWEDLTTLLAVYDGNDNLIWRFEYADMRMPVAMTNAQGRKYYLHYDQVGSMRAVSDSNGNIVKEITYDTYGNIIADSNPSFKVPFGFSGGGGALRKQQLLVVFSSARRLRCLERSERTAIRPVNIPDTKLTHFGYREYDPYTGKWTAKDPILFAGGDSNLYGYVLNDPVNLVDPEGLFAPAVYYGFYYAAMFASGYWAIHESIPHAQNLINSPVWNVPTYDDGSVVCEANPVDKNKEPDHPDYIPHKKKRGLQKIPWNKNRKGWPAKDGTYWEPVPDGHRGTHDPHWDQQFPDGSHIPKYPKKGK